MEYILRRFLILNILKKYPNITRYRTMKFISTLQFNIRVATLYSLFKILKEDGLIKSNKIEVATKIGNRGWWLRRTKRVALYSLTSDGYKELFKLEGRIRILLDLTIGEQEV